MIKFVVTSEVKAEVGALFITTKESNPLQKTLDEMGWPEPPYPLQTGNYTA